MKLTIHKTSTMKKTYLLLLAACMLKPAMAQEKFELGKPNNSNYRYLDDYQALKDYIDYSKYPNFKLGAGTTVSDYLYNSTFKNLINKNFIETVAGNAMKMASCVDAKGNMNFSTVKSYVKAATDAGLNVYGHTLAWHSQQPKAWLLKLVADKPAPELEDADFEFWETVASKDYRVTKNVGWTSDQTKYNFSISFDATNGLKVTTNKSYSWEVQFDAMSDIMLQTNKSYKMTITIKGSKSGHVNGTLGNFNGGASFDASFTTQWNDVEMTIKPTMESSLILMHIPSYVGNVYIKSIKFEELKKGKTINEERRCMKAHATARQANVWDNQIWLVPGSFSSGASYVFKADVRADKAAFASTQIHSTPGSFVDGNAFGNIYFTPEWKTITVSGKFAKAGQSIAFNLSELAEENTYYFDNVSLKINGTEKMRNGDFEGTNVSTFKAKEYGGDPVAPTIVDNLTYVYVPGTIPLSQQERHDTLVYAMDKWIKGMMTACGGKVKAWDLVNEAISGGGDDGSGNYVLQGNNPNGNPDATWDVGGDAFFWQDYMGSLEYVRQACRLARKYGPEDIVLFINDYNLESDWDDNKKLKSLINWIKKWEADGVTKIDGIGTQMHISYYENSSTQSSKKSAITNMFKLMAKTGKYVRVSELDMGYVDANGNAISTNNMTEAQHKNMANFYEWIIKEFFRLVPVNQQWGICQWCTNDAPAGSGWRKGEPVGIWDLNNYRKHAYAGFVRGLGGVVYTAPDGVDGIEADEPADIDTSKGIYNINGMPLKATSLDKLPSGLYIVNGKKIAIK